MLADRNKRIFSKKIKQLLQWFSISIISFLIILFLRIFVFTVVNIPTPSMEPTIIRGDQVIVNKLIPGPRIFYNLFSTTNTEKLKWKRLPGWRSIKHNDILVFNFPYSKKGKITLDPNIYYIKRCIAIPGDTFNIENGIYKVKGISDTLGNLINQQLLNEIDTNNLDDNILQCFPHDSSYNWNIKNFGPLYIPRKGDAIKIDTANIILYKNLIEYESKKSILIDKNCIILGDSTISEYIFLKNYYFLAGDYVFDSIDSRYWGVLPEDHILGKASFVWNTIDIHNHKTRWSRFLKTIK